MQKRGSVAVTTVSIVAVLLVALGGGVLVASLTHKTPASSPENQETNLNQCPEPYLQMVDSDKTIAGIPIQEATMNCVVGSFTPEEVIARGKKLTGLPIEITGTMTSRPAAEVLPNATASGVGDAPIALFETSGGFISVQLVWKDSSAPTQVRVRGLYTYWLGSRDPLLGTLIVPTLCPTCVEILK